MTKYVIAMPTVHFDPVTGLGSSIPFLKFYRWDEQANDLRWDILHKAIVWTRKRDALAVAKSNGGAVMVLQPDGAVVNVKDVTR